MSILSTFLILSSFSVLFLVSGQGIPASQCSTGPTQCCLGAGYASQTQIASVLAYLHIVVQDPDHVIVGLTCTPISGVGLGTGSCNALPLCCQDNTHGGIVAIGCTAVNLNL